MRRAACVLVAAMLVLGCTRVGPTLQVVEEVDLDRYVGRWYEIASFPQHFQEGCVASTATYTRTGPTTLHVVNECRDETLDGEVRSAEGHAWVVDPAESLAKLEVQFFWPFSGSYWIIELDPEYRNAVIGHPSRDYLWILSREREMSRGVYEALLARIAAHGYDLGRLQRTLQGDPANP